MSTAEFEIRTSWLGKEFGENYARRLFGDAVVDSMPKYSRGKNTGKFKVSICWVKCTRGGWVRLGAGEGNGFVENRRGSTLYAVLKDSWSGEIFATMGDFNYDKMMKS